MLPGYRTASCCSPANPVQLDLIWIEHLHAELSGLVPGVITERTVILDLSCSQAGGGRAVAVVRGGWGLAFPPFL